MKNANMNKQGVDGELCRESNGWGLEPSYCHFYVGHHGKHSFEIGNPIKQGVALRAEIAKELEDFYNDISGTVEGVDVEVHTLEFNRATTKLLTIVLEEVESKLPNCDESCEHKDTHQGHTHIWWEGYKQAQSEVKDVIKILKELADG